MKLNIKINKTIVPLSLLLALQATATIAAPIQDKMGGHKSDDMASGMNMEAEKAFDAVAVIH